MLLPTWLSARRADCRRPVMLHVEALEDRCVPTAVIRAIDGSGNNLDNPQWGKAGTPLARAAPPAYADGASSLAGPGRPGAREISNLVLAQPGSILNDRGLSDFVWQWGQFLDHDLDLTGAASPPEAAPIPIPQGDPQFDPAGTGTQTMPFTRSLYAPGSPRQQVNEITAYLDASNVYGSDGGRALALREGVGGRLLVSPGNLLPFNTFAEPLPNATPPGADPAGFYVAGDVRSNEQVALTALHTLFVREHNRIADGLAAEHPDWSDEDIYQQARKVVGAELQAITYGEFLPALLGPYAPSGHGHYDKGLNPSILNEFSTALFRVGHTMLSPQILRLQNDGSPDPRGPISLAGAFFNPGLLASGHDLDVILHGLAGQPMQEVDARVIDAVRNFLFGPPGAGGLDLPALNIQRGRDHGLPDYNTLRAAFGLPRVTSFADITSDVGLQQALQAAYGSVDDIDPWVGALAEDHLPGASVGPLLAAGFREQFRRLRDGDRFWFEHDPAFSPSEVQALRRTTLADVIRRNTGAQDIPNHVFFVHQRRRGTGALDAALALSAGTAETFVASGAAPAGALLVSPPADPGTADPGPDDGAAEPTASGGVSVSEPPAEDGETGWEGLEERDLLFGGADLGAGL